MKSKRIIMSTKCPSMIVHIWLLSTIRYRWMTLTLLYFIWNNSKPITVLILSGSMVYPSGTVRTFIRHMLIFSARLILLCCKKFKNYRLILTNSLVSLSCSNIHIISFLTIITEAFRLLYIMISFLITYRLLILPFRYFIFVNIFISMMSLVVLE